LAEDCHGHDVAAVPLAVEAQQFVPHRQAIRLADKTKINSKKTDQSSVANPDPTSGAFLTPGFGIRNRFFSDSGPRNSDTGSQTHIFERLVTIFLGKKF
jgi:hypothetical protein